MSVPDVVVHNAVRATFETFLEADLEELERNFRINTTSLLYMARAFAPAMVERGSSRFSAVLRSRAVRRWRGPR